jgi:CubicO group peptidase (beta-lactamase class C family)
MRTLSFLTFLLFLGTASILCGQDSKQKQESRPPAQGIIPVPVPPASWMAIGQNSRPLWVSASTERRLRLLQALPTIEATLSTQVSKYFNSSGPGMSVGLVLDDGLYYSRGFGFRDMQKSQIPDEETVYCVGSLTKVFTGTTLLTLRDASNSSLTLDDDVSRYVPEIGKLGVPPSFWTIKSCGPVKLRHLVSHTSGLPNEMERPREADEQQWLDELQHTELAFCPGNFSAYSGVGAETVGLIIERYTGQPYTTAVTDRLLSPLGMKHSVFGPAVVEASRKAQNWQMNWNASYTTPMFTPDSSWQPLDMLTAARDLFSSVWDLARFHKMWLAMEAPADILKKTTLQDSGQNVVPASTMPIPTTCATFNDGQGSAYSKCGDAAAFGVNWVIQSPLIWHNGKVPNKCGSNSILNPSQKIGATGVISTDPFPTVPLNQTQPAGTDSNFMGTVVSSMLNTAQGADTTTDWKTSPLAVGVARLLWLLGAKMPASTLGCKPAPHGRGPGVPLYPGMNKPDQCNQQALQQFEATMLDHFGRLYRAKHQLDSDSVVEHVFNILRKDIGPCSTFRVRGAPAPDRLRLRLQCAPAQVAGLTSYDMTLTVETTVPYRIVAIDDAQLTADPF